MMNYKRWSAMLFSFLAVLLLLPISAFAADSINLSRDVSMTISYQDGSTPLTGAKFDIYLVATLDKFGELTTTGNFTQFNVDIRGSNAEAWKTLASTLEGYVLRDDITPVDSGKTDSNGLIFFPSSDSKNLTPGLYLVLGYRHTQNGYRYDPSPFMVMLPGLDKENNVWVYDVTANAKYDYSEIKKDPDGNNTIDRKVLKVWQDDGYELERPKEVIVQLLRNGKVYDTVTLNANNNWRYTWKNLNDAYTWTVAEKELKDYTVKVTREGSTFVVTNTYNSDIPYVSKPNLPQTGQLWWPVPLLICAGLLFVVIGLVLRRGIDDERR